MDHHHHDEERGGEGSLEKTTDGFAGRTGSIVLTVTPIALRLVREPEIFVWIQRHLDHALIYDRSSRLIVVVPGPAWTNTGVPFRRLYESGHEFHQDRQGSAAAQIVCRDGSPRLLYPTTICPAFRATFRNNRVNPKAAMISNATANIESCLAREC
jgi:hypothetical protein